MNIQSNSTNFIPSFRIITGNFPNRCAFTTAIKSDKKKSIILPINTKITENGVQWSNPELNKLEITVVGLPNFKNSIILDESSSSDFLISFADKSVQDLANLGSRYVTAYYRTMILAGICRRRVYGESLKE